MMTLFVIKDFIFVNFHNPEKVTTASFVANQRRKECGTVKQMNVSMMSAKHAFRSQKSKINSTTCLNLILLSLIVNTVTTKYFRV